MKKIYVFGHVNPDTDSIASAIVAANLENALGYNATAYKLGPINNETKFVLNKFNIKEPKTLESIGENDNVIMIDSNEFSQSVKGIENANIKMIIDHHCIDLHTNNPIYCMAEPVGCTSTILYKLYKQNDVDITRQMAGLMLSAIISDTLLLKSPTCTKQDKDIADRLSKIAELDINKYGKELLEAGADISNLTAKEIINMDTKQFNYKDFKFEIAQVNTYNFDSVFKLSDSLKQAILDTIESEKLLLYVLAVTNIQTADSKFIVLGNRTDVFESAFNVKLEDNSILLKKIVSRKKQILPRILNTIDKTK